MDDRVAYPYRAEEGVDRGRGAESPREVPPRGWKDVLVRVMRQVKSDNVPLLAAGVAFFALLALVPSLVALVSVYGLVAEPADIQRNIEDALAAAPTEVRDLVSSQLSSIVESEPSGLRLGVAVGLVLALWSASSGVKYLIAALNVAYDQDEGRKFVKLRGLALAFTLGAIVLAAVALGALVVLPATLDSGGWEGTAPPPFPIVPWPPVANFGNYNETYGALGAIVVVMLWLFISAYVVIVGAELNAELERQTAVDSTTGPSRPLGERAAYAADTVGPSTAKR